MKAGGTRESVHNISYGLVSMVGRTDMAKILQRARKKQKHRQNQHRPYPEGIRNKEEEEEENSLVISHTKAEYKDDVRLRYLPRPHATIGRQKLTEYCSEINLSNEDPSLVL